MVMGADSSNGIDVCEIAGDSGGDGDDGSV